MVSPGSMAKVPLENYTKITIHANPAKKQKQLCDILENVCSGKSNDVNKDLIQKSKGGIQFLEFQVKNDTGKESKGLPFYFEIENNDGQKLVVHFYVDVKGEVSKRSGDPIVNTREWAIDRADDLFPIYNQHMCPGSCYSGCVPVAWAMILAYYDRIAESNSKATVSAFGKECWSKEDGDDGVAPLKMNTNVKKYVEKIRKTLKTYCIGEGGGTNPSDTGRIKEFTDKRKIKSKFFNDSVTVRKESQFLDITAKFIKAGYPVQVSILLSPTSGHAVVATKYREKTTMYKECRGRSCQTKSRKESEVYLNMGWGGASNGWKKPDIYGIFALLKEDANLP